MTLNNSLELPYWTPQQRQMIEQAASYDAMLPIIFEVLNFMPPPIGQVCGPISSGGRGSIEKNLDVFQRVIHQLRNQSYTIFDQQPMEVPIQRLRLESGLSNVESNLQMCEAVYRPIFESGLVSTLYFIPGWESSTGARWERDIAQELQLRVIDLDSYFVESDLE